jgi:3-isopropylmalate/(R)-2-methylmalate dehydratase large subunit
LGTDGRVDLASWAPGMTANLAPPAATLLEKIWEDHVVVRGGGGEPDLLYVDLHLVQEVSSPQAFAGLRSAGRIVRRPELTLATADHSVPTLRPPGGVIVDRQSRLQVEALERNCGDFGIRLEGVTSLGQGIVHVIAPEQGLTQPGMLIVCGDSHTSTHGAFGAFAFGIGTSEVEQVLATQCLFQFRPGSVAVDLRGSPSRHVTAKDLALGLIARVGTDAGIGSVFEYRGPAVRALSMEGRMTLSNMSIEAGARAGLIAPDDVTFAYLLRTPSFDRSPSSMEELRGRWDRLRTDRGARFEREIAFDVSDWSPMVSWGTTPAMTVGVNETVPTPESTTDPDSTDKALRYMGLRGGEAITDLAVDRVFIGSCTNGRIEDLRAAAAVVEGRRVADRVRALVVPGSMRVKAQAEKEGLDQVFLKAGFEWRSAGCSMCVGMNEDRLAPAERCASTSNRNFEGRQGPGGRTHLVSPPMAAAAALAGHFVDVRALG